MGAKKNPFYRIIVTDSRTPRDGRYIESIGTYQPLSEPAGIQIEEEKLFGWLKNGAQPSDPVWDLLSRLGLRQKWEMIKRGEDLSSWEPPAPRAPKRKKKAKTAVEKETVEKVPAEKVPAEKAVAEKVTEPEAGEKPESEAAVEEKAEAAAEPAEEKKAVAKEEKVPKEKKATAKKEKEEAATADEDDTT
jgi:small subunit ribosomal protein S16